MIQREFQAQKLEHPTFLSEGDFHPLLTGSQSQGRDKFADLLLEQRKGITSKPRLAILIVLRVVRESFGLKSLG